MEKAQGFVTAAFALLEHDLPLFKSAAIRLFTMAGEAAGRDVTGLIADLGAEYVDVKKLIADAKAAFGM